MKRSKGRYLDYFVNGNILIPAVFLTFDRMSDLLDEASTGKVKFVTKRRKGA